MKARDTIIGECIARHRRDRRVIKECSCQLLLLKAIVVLGSACSPTVASVYTRNHTPNVSLNYDFRAISLQHYSKRTKVLQSSQLFRGEADYDVNNAAIYIRGGGTPPTNTNKNGGDKTHLSGGKLKKNGTATTNRQTATVLRLKREYKDSISMGVAYDWIKGQQIFTKRKRIHSKNFEDSHDIDDCYIRLGPLGQNLLVWHFSIQGPPNSPYARGLYHGRILLPKDYPLSPPRIQLVTPNGRFIPLVDICLSASSYHPETWSPQWTILALVQSLRLHFLTEANEIGGIASCSRTERERLASLSQTWKWRIPSCRNAVVNHAHMVAALDNKGFRLEAAQVEKEYDISESAAAEKVAGTELVVACSPNAASSAPTTAASVITTDNFTLTDVSASKTLLDISSKTNPLPVGNSSRLSNASAASFLRPMTPKRKVKTRISKEGVISSSGGRSDRSIRLQQQALFKKSTRAQSQMANKRTLLPLMKTMLRWSLIVVLLYIVSHTDVCLQFFSSTD